MNILRNVVCPGFVLTLSFAALHGQAAPRSSAQQQTDVSVSSKDSTIPDSAVNAPSNPAVNPVFEGQVQDEMTRRITVLVHEGRYAEAQKLTDGLLIAYPNDQRLIKARVLIEKLLLAVGPSSAVSGASQPTPSETAQNGEHFAGMDKVDYNALIELAREAQQTTDLEQQTTLLRQFMKDSDSFLQRHPSEMLLWQLRAASAMSLNDLVEGYVAGQKLLGMGASDSNDPSLQRLMAQLKNKGWLDNKAVNDLRERTEHDRYTFLGEHQGTWHTFRGRLTLNENDVFYEGVDGTIRFSRNDVREISQFHYGVKFFNKDGKNFWFFPYYASDVPSAKKCCESHEFMLSKGTILLDAIVERWHFVSSGSKAWDRTLKPATP